jgi:hypothetical protein
MTETDHVILDVLEGLEGFMLIVITKDALKVLLHLLGQLVYELLFVGTVVLVADEKAVLKLHVVEIPY